jgi:hypothetical protein
MLNVRSYIDFADIFDPYNMLPIEKTITCLGERR